MSEPRKDVLSKLEREWAQSYVLIHSRLINKCVREGDLVTALAEARSVAAALEQLAPEAVGDA